MQHIEQTRLIIQNEIDNNLFGEIIDIIKGTIDAINKK